MREFLFSWRAVLCAAWLAATASAAPLRVLQFNVWQEGANVPDGLEKIAAVILESRADVVAFSEVRNARVKDWHGQLIAALQRQAPAATFYGQFLGGDVGLVSRLPIASTEIVFDAVKRDAGSIMAYRLTDPGGRQVTVCTAHLDYRHYALNLIRGYHGGEPDWKVIDADGDGVPDRTTAAEPILAYNRRSERGAAIEAFLAFAAAEEKAGREVILAGDFNEGSDLDWSEKAKTLPSHYGAVIPWDNSLALARARFRDGWRAVFPDEVEHPGFTWPATAFGKRTTSWAPLSDERDRIDFIYASRGLRATGAWIVGPRTCFVGSDPVADPGRDPYLCTELPWPSDHKAVLVEYDDGAERPRP